jgi:Kef-type K+ transport system membrane component KefB
MHDSDLIFVFFVIFFGASVFATIALFTRQTLIIAYLLLGALVGPYGFKIISSTEVMMQISNIGIIFLLFLLGLNLQFKSLMKIFNKTLLVTIGSSIIFGVSIFLLCGYYGFSQSESLLISASLIFSSTIICLKLLPTTALHHQDIGNIVIGVLLLQDIIAILVMTILGIVSVGMDHFGYLELLGIIFSLPILICVGYLVEKHLLHFLLRKFNRISEYIFLLAIGWCLAMSQLAVSLGAPAEVGAFIGGVILASSPISPYIYESLKPLRDFFLIVFFFSVGASFNFHLIGGLFPMIMMISVFILFFKPIVYWLLLLIFKEERKTAWEVGIRLGQASEFSLLIAFLAYQSAIISDKGFIVIQAVTVLSFIFSSYFVVLRLPNPIAISDKLRRD